MDLSAHIRTHARTIPGKIQLILTAFARALEIIPRQICDNAGLDSTDVLNKLRQRHASGDIWAGVDVDGEGVRDNMAAFVWEPSLVKTNAIGSAAEAACLILSVDETVRNPQSEAVRLSHPQLSFNPVLTSLHSKILARKYLKHKHKGHSEGEAVVFHGVKSEFVEITACGFHCTFSSRTNTAFVASHQNYRYLVGVYVRVCIQSYGIILSSSLSFAPSFSCLHLGNLLHILMGGSQHLSTLATSLFPSHTQ